VQYGKRIGTFVLDLLHYQLLPETRLAELTADLFSVHLETSLYVADPDCARDFYQRIFGPEVFFQDSRMCALGVTPGQVLLLFRHTARPTRQPPSRAAASHRTAPAARHIPASPSRWASSPRGRRIWPGTAWRWRAESPGNAAARAGISAIPTDTRSKWPRRDPGRISESASAPHRPGRLPIWPA